MDIDILGTDLDLGFVADEEGRVFAGPDTQVDLQAIERLDVAPRTKDLKVVNGHANLVQSLIVRLKTEQGELTGLGMPKYGSRHHRLVGELNTENNRSLIKLYILECLKQEPRLAKIKRVDVKPVEGLINRDKVKVEIEAAVKGETDPLNLIIPFSFGETL